MIANQHITKIILVIMAIAVCLCLAAMLFAGELTQALGGADITMEYESKLFDTSEPITVNIMMDEADWADMLENATAEEYYQCDVEINGETVYRVGIRPKGNTSLTAIASDPTTDRFSFKLEFDQYVDGQTCYGLDKLVLNNNYADATSMKEALIYDMYQYLGADASLYNYAVLYINGEYWGVYLALEAVEDSFLLRNYGTENGELYKPDSMNIGGGAFENMTPPEQGGSFDISQFGDPPEMPDTSGSAQEGAMPDTLPDRESFDGSFDFGGMFSMGGGGANLNYTDDDLDSYSTIWEGEITNTTDSDHKRVVTALKHIAEGTDLETYMDIDNLLKYMAVHVFSVNEDSLSGMMAHNYYLYESDGRLNILPWDYNLALGGMGGMGSSGDTATSVVNDAIDQAFSGTNFFDTLMENEEYRERYYAYLRQLAEEYILGGGFDAFFDRTRAQIDQLVETDPTAFYSYEEYLTAVDTLYEVVTLRGESILGQLDGTIPSLEREQQDSDALIDASFLDLSVMGSMSMGDGLWNMEPEENHSGESGLETSASGQDTASSDENRLPEEELSEDFDPSQIGNMELPEGFDPSQAGNAEFPEGFNPFQTGDPSSEETESFPSEESTRGDDEAGTSGEESVSDGAFSGDWGSFENGGNTWGQMPGMGSNSSMGSSLFDSLILYGGCLVVLIAAFVFVKKYRRNPRKR